MPRRREVPKRDILPIRSLAMSKFQIHERHHDGKKVVTGTHRVWRAGTSSAKGGKDPLEYSPPRSANAKPMVE